MIIYIAGPDPVFQARVAHLKKLPRAEGGAKNFGVFRVKNHDFTPKNQSRYMGTYNVDLNTMQGRIQGGLNRRAPPLKLEKI
jgi:hypothetical protein